MTEPTWKPFSYDEPETYPEENGFYRIAISGDSETCDGHVVYSYEAYETFGVYEVDGDGMSFIGQHDEEVETITAYYGPLVFPPCPKELKE